MQFIFNMSVPASLFVKYIVSILFAMHRLDEESLFRRLLEMQRRFETTTAQDLESTLKLHLTQIITSLEQA